ncbi:Uncharacterised protein [Vibrio cholerae]|nr:Uncharacterised protein [Vibrio cholerae]CSI15954.1 Uncharacterised protein [Vibrio cholerae]
MAGSVHHHRLWCYLWLPRDSVSADGTLYGK